MDIDVKSIVTGVLITVIVGSIGFIARIIWDKGSSLPINAAFLAVYTIVILPLIYVVYYYFDRPLVVTAIGVDKLEVRDESHNISRFSASCGTKLPIIGSCYPTPDNTANITLRSAGVWRDDNTNEAGYSCEYYGPGSMKAAAYVMCLEKPDYRYAGVRKN